MALMSCGKFNEPGANIRYGSSFLGLEALEKRSTLLATNDSNRIRGRD
jgi:hypothetical protein